MLLWWRHDLQERQSLNAEYKTRCSELTELYRTKNGQVENVRKLETSPQKIWLQITHIK